MSPHARWRLRYSKLGKLRFVGHRDVARLWERALRAAQVPVALSAGFTPRPRMSFGLALPTGAESRAEYLDVIVDRTRLAADVSLDEVWLLDRVAPVLPPGLTLDAAIAVDVGAASLQESVVASTWELTLQTVPGFTGEAQLMTAVERVLAADEVPLARERKGVTSVDDVRSSIERLSPRFQQGGIEMTAVLATQGRALRPAELVRALLPECDPFEVLVRVLRTHQWIEDDGARRELQPAAGAHASARGGTTWTAPIPPPGHSPNAATPSPQLTTT